MKREGIHGLIQYLNKTTNNATNTQVAKAIVIKSMKSVLKN